MAEHTPTRFRISYDRGAYYVSIPNYAGGEVVDATTCDKLVKALRVLCDEIADTEAHGDGAYDQGCSVCDAHKRARKLLRTLSDVGGAAK